jgi:hypothetical protein
MMGLDMIRVACVDSEIRSVIVAIIAVLVVDYLTGLKTTILSDYGAR